MEVTFKYSIIRFKGNGITKRFSRCLTAQADLIVSEKGHMKALSIQQPWAWAILHGKPVENRTWPTRFTGQFLIHAGKKFDHEGYRWLLDNRDLLTAEIPHRDLFQCGGFVGKSRIVDCVNYHPSPFFFGPLGFVLADSHPTFFVPYRGQLGFFEVPREIANQALEMDGQKDARHSA